MALGYMRRHKKWLYVFLWLVIAAFIVLYVPALDPTDEGTPNEAVVTIGDLEVSVGEYQRAYSRRRQFYSRLYQGRLDENMIRQLGLEEQVLDGLVIERLVELEADATRPHDLRRSGRRGDLHIPRLSGQRAVHRRRRAAPPPRARRHDRAGVRRVAASPAPARAAGGPRGRRRGGQRLRGRARVPPSDGASRARVRPRPHRAVPGRDRADGRSRRQPLRGGARHLSHSRETHRLLRASRS